MDKFEPLKIDNQLCFPLYACAKEVIKLYKPLLAPLDLTYTQFITMMVLWEEGEMNVKDLGKKLFLDSGTLTPVLKKLESKGLITRQRSKEDERVLLVTITSEPWTCCQYPSHPKSSIMLCSYSFVFLVSYFRTVM